LSKRVHPPSSLALGGGQGDEKMLRTDIVVLELVGFFLSVFKNAIEAGAEMDIGLSFNRRKFRRRFRKFLRENRDIDAEFLENREHHAVLLLDERPEQVLRRNLGIALFLSMRLRGLQRFLTLQREFVESDHRVLPASGLL